MKFVNKLIHGGQCTGPKKKKGTENEMETP